jgi:hypothetical protein
MESLALPLVNVAAAIWVGAIVFQSFFVAPVLFRHVEGPVASRFLRALFPKFYWLGLGCGVAMLAGALALTSADRLLWVIGLMVAAEAVSLWLVPRINAARDAGAAGAARFRRLHALSVGLTLIVLALGLWVLATLVRSPGAF